MLLTMNTPPNKMRLVPQVDTNGCGIACVAMIMSVSYAEVWRQLAPVPTNEVGLEAFGVREREFLNRSGWWQTAQLISHVETDLNTIDFAIVAKVKNDSSRQSYSLIVCG